MPTSVVHYAPLQVTKHKITDICKSFVQIQHYCLSIFQRQDTLPAISPHLQTFPPSSATSALPPSIASLNTIGLKIYWKSTCVLLKFTCCCRVVVAAAVVFFLGTMNRTSTLASLPSRRFVCLFCFLSAYFQYAFSIYQPMQPPPPSHF